MIDSAHNFFENELHTLLDLAYASAAGETEGFFPFLKKFKELFNGHSASFSIYNTKKSHMIGFWTIGMSEESLAIYSKNIAHQDILLEVATSFFIKGEHRFVSTNLDFDNYAKRMSIETGANKWLESYGAKEVAGAIAYWSEDYITLFAMQRSKTQKNFTREELKIFDKILPHIKRSAKIYINNNQNTEESQLESTKKPVIIIDQNYKVSHHNKAAEKEIIDKGIIEISKEKTISIKDKNSHQEVTKKISEAMENSIQNNTEEEIITSIKTKKENKIIAIRPLKKSKNSKASVAMIHYQKNTKEKININLLQQLFDLTPTESKIAQDLASGISLQDITKLHSRSRETIKFHMRNIFRKTGTERQGELIALITASCTPL